MQLIMPIPAVIGLVSFGLAMIPYTFYYQTPMVVIGKVYTNSVLVLINSRMLLRSVQMPPTITSADWDNGDVTPNTEAHAGPSGSS